MKHLFTICALLALSNAMGQTPEYVPTSGLVSWWNLNGDAIDEVGGNDGIQFGTSPTSNRQGQEGQALGFDGDDYVSLDTFFGGAQMTEASYSLWFNSTDNGGTQYVSGKEGFWRTIYVLLTSDGVIRFGGTSGGVYFGVSTEEDAFEFGTWNHLVVNFIDSQITLFLNGAEVISGPSTTSFLDYQFYAAGNSTATNYFGAIHPVSAGITNHFVGSLDEFGLWNRALDEEEVSALYLASTSISGCTDPEACNFNEAAIDDDGSCDYACCPGPGCCDVGMYWDWELGMCQITNVADTNLDGCVQLNDLLDLLSAYGNCTEAEVAEHPCSGGAFSPGDDIACTGWNYLGAYDGGEYYVSSIPVAWDSAQAFAVELNGGLAVISSQEENDWISNLVGDNYVWIGLYQDLNSTYYSEPDGGWGWVNGAPFVYENWASNSPNNVNNGAEHHCQMYSNGLWNDAPGDLFINGSDGRDIYAVIEFR